MCRQHALRPSSGSEACQQDDGTVTLLSPIVQPSSGDLYGRSNSAVLIPLSEHRIDSTIGWHTTQPWLRHPLKEAPSSPLLTCRDFGHTHEY